MPSIHSVMKRLGFVKLRDYGLVLTPEGRILSIRPAVLDDGVGGRIVGWKDDDLAAMELDRWSEMGRAMASKPAAPPAVAKPVAVRPIASLAPPPPPAKPVASARPMPGLPPVPAMAPAPVGTAPAALTKPPIPAATPQKALGVAPEPVVEEDDWEWTIAIARARAAAEEAEQAAAAAQRPPTAPRPKVTPAAPSDPIKRDSWESTQPLNEFDVSDYTSPTNQVLRVVKTPGIPARDAVPSLALASAFVDSETAVDPPTRSERWPLVKTAPMVTVAERSEKTTPMAKVAEPATPKTAATSKSAPTASAPPPLGVPTPAQPLPVVKPTATTPPNRSFSRGLSPVTVIPIPKIPKVEPSRIAPVVARRTGPAPVVPIGSRLAKGTTSPPISNASASRASASNANQVGDETKPNLVGEQTLPSLLLSR